MTAATKSVWAPVVLFAALLGGCGDDPQPTGIIFAVAQADEALRTIRDDAARHAPTELAKVESEMAGVKVSVSLRRYKEAARYMEELGPNLADLIQLTKDRKAAAQAEHQEAAAKWNAIADEVPRTIATLQQRIDAAAKAGKPPAGLNAAAYEDFKAQFEKMKTTWAEADDAVTRSKATEAATKAQEAKAIGDALLAKLK